MLVYKVILEIMNKIKFSVLHFYQYFYGIKTIKYDNKLRDDINANQMGLKIIDRVNRQIKCIFLVL
jgi:hypothetical protein